MRSPSKKSVSSISTENIAAPTSPPATFVGDDPELDDLNDSYPYQLQAGDDVWVFENDEWILGVVAAGRVKAAPTRMSTGNFYPVFIPSSSASSCGQSKTSESSSDSEGVGQTPSIRKDKKIRKHFAPLNGEIKPNTPHVRKLLKDAGWL